MHCEMGASSPRNSHGESVRISQWWEITEQVANSISRFIGRAGLLWSFILGIISFLLVSPFHFFDPDLHHDGVMVATAIGVSEGNALFSEVFSQYGLTTAVIQASFLWLWPFGELLGIRLLAAFQISVIVFLLSDFGRIAPTRLGLSHQTSSFLALLVLFSWDGFLGISPAPWSSLTAGAILVILLYLGAFLSSSLRDWVSVAIAFLFGLLLGFLPFTRQSVGVLAVLGIVLAFILAKKYGRVSYQTAGFTAAGLLTALVGILTYLALTGSFWDWWQQTVLWPLDWASSKDSFVFKTIERFLPWTAGPAVASILFPLLMRNHRPAARVWFSVGAFFYSGFLSALTGKGFGVGTLFPEAEAYDWSLGLVHFGYGAISFLIFASLAGTLALLIKTVIDVRSGNKLDSLDSLVLFLALSSLSQAVPVMDTRHFWWSLPVPLVATALFYRRAYLDHGDLRPSRVALGLPLVSIASVALLAGSAYGLLVNRSPLGDETVFRGMWAREATAAEVLEGIRRVEQLQPGVPHYFVVKDGYLSVLFGKWDSEDAYFVSWGPTPPLESRVSVPGDYLLQGDETVEELMNLARKAGLDVAPLPLDDDFYLLRIR